MLKIEQLNLNLPFTYQNDARSIAERVADHLAQMDHSVLKDTSSLTIPTVHIGTGADINEVALHIANSIYKNLRGV